jgi:hypothetical protein
MRYILAVSFLAYSSVALGAGELSFTAADLQEHKIQSAAPADPDIEARLNAPDDPIPPPRLLPINDPPQAPPNYAPRPTMAAPAARPAMPVQTVQNPRPAPGIARALPQKRVMPRTMPGTIAQNPRTAQPITANWKPLAVSRTAPQYAHYIPRKTMVALMTKKRKKSRWTHAIMTPRRPAPKRVATDKPKTMV